MLNVGSAALVERANPGAVLLPRGGSLIGAFFEALVTQSVQVYAQAHQAQVSHLRTKRGKREVDLIVERAAVLITTGHAAYGREDGIVVVPAALLGP